MEEKKNVKKKYWYCVTTFSGKENLVKENLELLAQSKDFSENIFRVVICSEVQQVLDKDGKQKMVKDADGNMVQKTKVVNVYPGHIYVEAVMDEKTWYIIRNTANVTGILGSSGKGKRPTPLRNSEMEPILKKVGIVDVDMYKDYVVGGNVRIINGTLAGVDGKIISIDREHNTVKISVVFFGKVTEIELAFADIVKI